MAFARTIFVTVGDIPSTVVDRNSLVMGVDQPNDTNTGILSGVGRTTVTGNVTLSTPGLVYKDVDLFGRLSVTSTDITIQNCRIYGDNSANALLTATNINVRNLNVIDTELVPQFTARNDQNGFNGHDTNFLRCNIHHVVDCAQINNSNQFNLTGADWDTGTSFQQCWLHDLAWWTASAGGIVHPSDTETHNDLIQIFGGKNLRVQGCTLDAKYARQYGHWFVTDPTTEPYTTVALNSLSDGGPYQPIPNRGSTGGLALSPGNEANGRYWWDDVSALMLNSQQGPTSDVLFTDNWCSGGNYFVNGGGNPLVGGHNLGQFLRNKFVDNQGDYGSGLGSETGHTLDFGGSYTSGVNVTAPTTGADKNYYIATNNGILVRA